MMKKWLPLVVLAAGCAGLSGSEGFVRVLAGLNCVAAITAAGGSVAADPDLGFSTALDALTAINKIATGPGLQTAMSACADTFKYLAEDMAGLKGMVNAKTVSTEPVAARRARMARIVPPAQASPVLVRVPLR